MEQLESERETAKQKIIFITEESRQKDATIAACKIETGKQKAEFDVIKATMEGQIKTLQNEILNLTQFEMPFALYVSDIFERAKPYGFDLEQRKIAKEYIKL